MKKWANARDRILYALRTDTSSFESLEPYKPSLIVFLREFKINKIHNH